MHWTTHANPDGHWMEAPLQPSGPEQSMVQVPALHPPLHTWGQVPPGGAGAVGQVPPELELIRTCCGVVQTVATELPERPNPELPNLNTILH